MNVCQARGLETPELIQSQQTPCNTQRLSLKGLPENSFHPSRFLSGDRGAWYNQCQHLPMLLHSSQHTQDTVFCLEISHFHRLTQGLPLFSWSWNYFQAPGFMANSRNSSKHQGCEPNGGEQVVSCAPCGMAEHWGQGLCLPSGALRGPPEPPAEGSEGSEAEWEAEQAQVYSALRI